MAIIKNNHFLYPKGEVYELFTVVDPRDPHKILA